MVWTRVQRDRLAIEKEKLEQYFRLGVTWIDPQGETKVQVLLKSNADREYKLRIYIPPDFPNSCPALVVVSPPKLLLKNGKWLPEMSYPFHTLQDTDGFHRICHFYPPDWTPDITLYQVFMKGRLWIEAYEAHLETGEDMDVYLGEQVPDPYMPRSLPHSADHNPPSFLPFTTAGYHSPERCFSNETMLYSNEQNNNNTSTINNNNTNITTTNYNTNNNTHCNTNNTITTTNSSNNNNTTNFNTNITTTNNTITNGNTNYNTNNTNFNTNISTTTNTATNNNNANTGTATNYNTNTNYNTTTTTNNTITNYDTNTTTNNDTNFNYNANNNSNTTDLNLNYNTTNSNTANVTTNNNYDNNSSNYYENDSNAPTLSLPPCNSVGREEQRNQEEALLTSVENLHVNQQPSDNQNNNEPLEISQPSNRAPPQRYRPAGAVNVMLTFHEEMIRRNSSRSRPTVVPPPVKPKPRRQPR